MQYLLSDQQGDAISGSVDWHGDGSFHASGDFNGASVRLETSFDRGETWLELFGSELMASGSKAFTLYNACLRSVITGGSSNSRLTAWLQQA